MEHLGTRVEVLRIVKAWRKGTKKMEVSLEPGSEELILWRTVLRPALIAKEKCQQKFGQAPEATWRTGCKRHWTRCWAKTK